MRSYCFAVVVIASLASPSVGDAQPAPDTAKFQTTILNLRACIRANAPPAYIAGIRSYDEAFQYFLGRCYSAFSNSLASLGASDAATGSFRLIVRDEWLAFRQHIGGF